MARRYIGWVVLSAVIMIFLPWLATAFVRSDAGMAVGLLLFFAVNPMYSVVLGAFAGKETKRMWSLPVISAVLFLLGAWIFFAVWETAFLLYAAIYLILGIMAMPVTARIRKKQIRSKEE